MLSRLVQDIDKQRNSKRSRSKQRGGLEPPACEVVEVDGREEDPGPQVQLLETLVQLKKIVHFA